MSAEQSTVDVPDPHESKIPADDPRLKLAKPRPRTLRKGPALAAAFGLLGVVLLALVFAFSPDTSGGDVHKDEAEDPAITPDRNFVIPEVIRNASDNTAFLKAAAGQTTPRLGEPLPGNLGSAMVVPPGGEYGGAGGTGDPARELRLQDHARARSASLFFSNEDSAGADGEGRARSGDPSVPSGPHLPQLPRATSGTAPGGGAGDSDQNKQSGKQEFVEKSSGAVSSDYVEQPAIGPRSPYELKAGTIIPTVLLTGINSDLPGQIIGQVRENVYDTVSGNHLLVPQGSRLLAVYDSMVAFGQDRVLVCWQRLIRPDGSSINLQCMPGVDLAGYSGFADQVDHHWWRIITGVAISSLLAAGTASSQGSISTLQPTFPQLLATGAAGQVAQAGQKLTDRNLNIQPTIKVRPGFSVNVLVSKDLIIPPYRER